jgi:MerR family transcriptional regulator, light-induced transcriptional regulator
MASVFGITGLKSRLDDWRGLRRSADIIGDADSDNSDHNRTSPGHINGDADLSQLLENLVIPKLIAGADQQRCPVAARALQPKAASRPAISAADVEEFTRLCISDDAHCLLDFVEPRLNAGNSVETIYIDLLAPAARRLGQYWEADSEDFVSVTMGLWRIQEVLRELTLRVPPSAHAGNGMRSALFTPMPGEQHSFGTLMVAEFFERAGWHVDVLIEPTQSELTTKCAQRRYDLVGLTVSCDSTSGALSGLVASVRAVSNNPDVKVLVGGRVINEQPDLAADCGADGTAVDAPSAVALADRLVPVKLRCLEDLV